MITAKDMALTLRDKVAWILMLLAPFLLTLGLGAVTGSFSSSITGIEAIPLIVINRDEGEMAASILDAFQQPGLVSLFSLSMTNDLQEGLDAIKNDKTAAVIVIPQGFSKDITFDKLPGSPTAPLSLTLYTNPERPISVNILETVLDEILSRIQAASLTGRIVVADLLASQRLSNDGIETLNAGTFGLSSGDQPSIQPVQVAVYLQETEQPAGEIDPLAYFAPGMAVFFLMFTVTQGGRSILAEREMGTFGRMLTTPIHVGQVLAGKVLGTFLTGFLQVSILILASSLLFGLDWGNPAAVAALIFAVVFGATGWGILMASLVRVNWQASALGSAMMLIFGILGGTFIPVSEFPEAVRWLGIITPNYWAIRGFTRLARGDNLVDLFPILAALLAMGLGLMALSLLAARKRWSGIGFSRGS